MAPIRQAVTGFVRGAQARVIPLLKYGTFQVWHISLGTISFAASRLCVSLFFKPFTIREIPSLIRSSPKLKFISEDRVVSGFQQPCTELLVNRAGCIDDDFRQFIPSHTIAPKKRTHAKPQRRKEEACGGAMTRSEGDRERGRQGENRRDHCPWESSPCLPLYLSPCLLEPWR